MTDHREQSLDVRTWLLWGVATMIPLLTGRHPVVIAELLLIVLIVRSVCLPPGRAAGWGWMIRLGAIAVPLGMLFNVLTVHAGDRPIFGIPDDVPVVGGEITWNALVYGLLSGMTIVVLVATGTTVAAALDWSELMRHIPARAANVAVAGSVAWAFLPQLSASWREIREAQAARGHQWRGLRDTVPLVVPLLAGGLDRSITMAEALESRGFGASASTAKPSSRSAVAMAGSLAAAVTGLYLFAVGQSVQATSVLLVAAALGLFAIGAGGTSVRHRTTHFRRRTWSQLDTLVGVGAVIAIIVAALLLQARPEAVRYEPYPSIQWPETSAFLVLALGALMLPAVVAPASSEPDEVESW